MTGRAVSPNGLKHFRCAGCEHDGWDVPNRIDGKKYCRYCWKKLTNGGKFGAKLRRKARETLPESRRQMDMRIDKLWEKAE